jgi:dTDP-glucose 4,6-dehydratase
VIGKLLRDETLYVHADEQLQSGTRFYLHCRTFANALHFLIENDSKQLPRKIHVCGEREISNLDLAQLIAGIVGKELHYELVSWQEDRPGHDLRYAMQDRLIQELGWKRPMNIEQSLDKTVRWYLANPKWLE